MEVDVVVQVATFVAGMLSGWLLARWEARRVAAYEGGNVSDHQRHTEHRGTSRSVPLRLVIPFAIAIFLLVLGVQQYQFQQQAERSKERQNEQIADAKQRDQCYEEWGNALVATVEKRVAPATAEAQAQRKKDRALDRIIFTVAALRAFPPQAVEDDLDSALARYDAASEELIEARQLVDATREENPYPELDCNSN